MTIDFLVFEDSRLKDADFEAGFMSARADFNLDAKSIELRSGSPVQVRSLSSLQQCIRQAAADSGEARIICVDMDLVQNGLTQDDGLSLHNSTLPEELCLAASDGRVAAGFLLAWKVLQSRHPRQLLVFASELYGSDRIEEQGRHMQESLGSHVPIRILRGGLSHPERRPKYIKTAIGWWMDAFYSPLSRLHPEGSCDWFKLNTEPDQLNPMPHTWRERFATNDAYLRTLIQYLASILQIGEHNATRCYHALSAHQKGLLHEYLKELVGSNAACHVGSGRRLQWRHLPLLAVLCAPPPGLWIFGDELLSRPSASVLSAKASREDSRLLRLLVGDPASSSKGCLSQILEGKPAPSSAAVMSGVRPSDESQLVNCEVAIDGCSIRVKYATRRLAANFAAGVKAGVRPGNDSSGVLYDLHGFVQAWGGCVEIKEKTVHIRQKDRRS